MGDEFVKLFEAHWPHYLWAIPVVWIMYYGLQALSLTVAFVEKRTGRLGRYWRKKAVRRAKRVGGQVDSLEADVQVLTAKVDRLELRDALYWDYVLYDQNWHRVDQFNAVAAGVVKGNHLTFMEFRINWLRARGINEKDDQFWL